MRAVTAGCLLLAGAAVVVGVYQVSRDVSDADEGRSYALPEDLCGLSVSRSALDSLLPPGGELEQREVDRDDEHLLIFCKLAVDGYPTVSVNVRRFDWNRSLMERYRETPSAYGIAAPHEVKIADELAIVGPDGSLVDVPCPNFGPTAFMEVNVRYYAEGVTDAEDIQYSMKELTEAIVSSARSEYDCEEQ